MRRTLKTRRKVSRTLKRLHREGKIKSWSEGLTKHTDRRLKLLGIKIGKSLKKLYKEGKRAPWNKGLTKDTHKSLLHSSKNLKNQYKKV